MKHLHKFNENISEDIDEEYLLDCFTVFIDSGLVKKYEKFEYKGIPSWQIEITKKHKKHDDNFFNQDENFIKELIGESKDEYEYYLDIEESIKKVAVEHDYIVQLDRDYNLITITFYKSRPIHINPRPVPGQTW